MIESAFFSRALRLLAPALLSACGAAGGLDSAPRCTLSAPPLSALHADHGHLLDADGRSVTLRGIAAGGRSKFAPYVPFDFDAAPGGFEAALGRYLDRAASWGLDVLRVPVLWAAVEPTRGARDEVYLGRITQLLEGAASRGMWTILDFHQDLYSEALCGDGFPSWTLEPAPALHHDCPGWFGQYLTDRRVQRAFDGFWSAGSTVAPSYLALWDDLATRFAATPGVIGFEPFNEPSPGSADGTRWARNTLAPFYTMIAARIRSRAPGALVFFDATGVDALSATTDLSRPDGDQLVFAPHFYDGAVLLESGTITADPRAGLGRWAALGASWGLPVLIGEFGVQADREGAGSYLRKHYDAFESMGLHAIAWEYSSAKDLWNNERLSVTEADGTEKESLVAEIARPYARAIAGQLEESRYDAASGTLRLSYQATQGGVSEIGLPARAFGGAPKVKSRGACVDVAERRILIRAEQAEVTIEIGPSG